ncbi:hypothetical protein KR018_001654, partial [Drosophila ironensis]
YRATLYSNIGSFLFGIALGWPGAAELSMVAGTSPYAFRPSKAEWDRMTILLTVGAATGCMPMGMLVRLVGCKRTLLVQLLPIALGWVLIAVAHRVELLYVGRFVLGVAGGAHCVAVPVYSSEISPIKLRGTMGVIFHAACTLGVTFIFMMAQITELWVINLMTIVLVPLGLLQLLIPESPLYYLRRDDKNLAQASLKKLRGEDYDCGAEMNYLMQPPTGSELHMVRNPLALFSQKKPRRSLFRIMLLNMLQRLCCMLIIVCFSVRHLCLSLFSQWVIVLCLGSIAGVFLSIWFVDRYGRRVLMISSTSVLFILSIILGVCFKYATEDAYVLHWFILVVFCVLIVAYNAGLGPLLWLLNAELSIHYIRYFVCAAGATVNWITASLVIIWFVHQPHECPVSLFILNSVVAVVVILFMLIVIPESKDMPEEEIQIRMGGIMNQPASVT